VNCTLGKLHSWSKVHAVLSVWPRILVAIETEGALGVGAAGSILVISRAWSTSALHSRRIYRFCRLLLGAVFGQFFLLRSCFVSLAAPISAFFLLARLFHALYLVESNFRLATFFNTRILVLLCRYNFWVGILIVSVLRRNEALFLFNDLRIMRQVVRALVSIVLVLSNAIVSGYKRTYSTIVLSEQNRLVVKADLGIEVLCQL